MSVLLAVHPTVTTVAQSNQIFEIKPQLRIARPVVNVVDMERVRVVLLIQTLPTLIIVSRETLASQFFPSSRGVFSLPFGTASVHVSRIQVANSAEHSIALASKVRSWLSSSYADLLPSLLTVVSSQPVIFEALLRPRVVLPLKVVAARSRGDIEGFQLVVDALRVSTNNFRYFIRRKKLYFVFLTKPFFIQVGRFSHEVILVHSKVI